MAMNHPEESLKKNWERLTQLARETPVPQVDVSRAVLRAIRQPAASGGDSLFDLLNSMISSGWLRGSLAALGLGSVFLGYEGLQNSETLMLALGFSF